MNRPPVFYLYTTLGCHLCDEAMGVITDLHAQMAQNFSLVNEEDVFFTITKVDIVEDDKLVDVYGARIPVLLSADKAKEIGWPFDVQSLYEFMVSCQNSA